VIGAVTAGGHRQAAIGRGWPAQVNQGVDSAGVDRAWIVRVGAVGQRVEGVRALRTARRSAVKARTAAANQIHQLLITAPDPIRDKFRALTGKKLVKALAQCRPAPYNPVNYAVLIGLKTIAQRHQYLDGQVNYLTAAITAVVASINPGLLAAHGVGPDTAAQLLITAGGNPDRLHREASFAALCGTAPSPHPRARSPATGSPAAVTAARTTRYTTSPWSECPATSRPGSRSPGNAPPGDQPQRSCACSNEPSPGRCSNTSPAASPSRPSTTSAPPDRPKTSLTQAAAHLGLWPTALTRIENGTKRDDTLASAYRAWLQAA
jgi:transposase